MTIKNDLQTRTEKEVKAITNAISESIRTEMTECNAYVKWSHLTQQLITGNKLTQIHYDDDNYFDWVDDEKAIEMLRFYNSESERMAKIIIECMTIGQFNEWIYYSYKDFIKNLI